MGGQGGKVGRSGAAMVAAGILLSRVIGFVRESFFAHVFGNSWAADAFKGALRIPNLLQNLLGEGVLSASFIPVYANLRSQGREEEARDLACAVGTLLGLLAALISLLGILFAPQLVDLIVPGFEGERRELTVQLVRLFFPGTAVLVLSAWCLGVLNSHRRFFLPYTAPVIWNGAIIFALYLSLSRESDSGKALLAGVGVLVGSFLQFLIQVPSVWRLLGTFRLMLGLSLESVRRVIKNFVPVVIGRGVVQISAFIDSLIASLLPLGAVATISYSQMIYLLPVSLFGMSVSAAELPEMSEARQSDEERVRYVRMRLENGMRQILFFVAPTFVAFLFFGDLIVATLYQSGRFRAEDTAIVWYTLCGMGLGLVPSTLSRLCASTFYAFGDTKSPLYISMVRVLISVALGFYGALVLPAQWGFASSWGVIALAGAAGGSSWLELHLLRIKLAERVGDFSVGFRHILFTILGALISAVTISYLRPLVVGQIVTIQAAVLIGCYGICYLILGLIGGLPEAKRFLRLRRV